MAIAIPLVMAYAGASAAISTAIGLTALVGAGVGAAVVGVGVGLAAQKLGINDRINKAASKVFGEDVVKIGNLVGAAVLMTGAVGGAATAAGGATDGAMSGLQDASSALDGTKSFTDMVGAVETGSGGVLGNASMGAAMAQAPTAAMDLPALSGVSAGASTAPFQFNPTDFAKQISDAQASNGVLSGTGKLWSGLGDKGQSALIQGGAGMLDSYMKSQDEQKRIAQAQQRQDLRSSGSGFFDRYAYGAGA